jgi:hypothetical protein
VELLFNASFRNLCAAKRFNKIDIFDCFTHAGLFGGPAALEIKRVLCLSRMPRANALKQLAVVMWAWRAELGVSVPLKSLEAENCNHDSEI